MNRMLPFLAVLAFLFGTQGDLRARAETPVDIELVLAVDLSLSMMPEELEIQRAGYAAALRDPAVVRAMLGGLHGRVAITFVEWAGKGDQAVLVPWALISSAGDADAFAGRITAERRLGWRRTSLSSALAYSAALFENNGFKGLRRIIDISGDGPNNDGAIVTLARDAVVDRGITVNGLPLMTRIGLMTVFDIRDLDVYYRECVIGGPGAFVIPVHDWDQFAAAVRRKLVLEMSGRVPSDRPAARLRRIAFEPDGYDCLVGEKLWQQRFEHWE